MNQKDLVVICITIFCSVSIFVVFLGLYRRGGGGGGGLNGF